MKKTVIALMLVVGILFLGGCPASDAEPQNLVIISGYHANSPTPSFNALHDRIYDALSIYGSTATVIIEDGQPYCAISVISKEPDKWLSPSKRKQIAEAETQQVLACLKVSKAKTPEIDTLAALSLAEKALPEVGNKTIIMFSSGLSTTGFVNFNENLLRADPDAVVEYISECEAIPDLSGVTVEWNGLGDVAEPQQPLTPKAAHNMEGIWGGILRKGGASVSFPGVITADTCDADLPPVSTVPVPQDEPFSGKLLGNNAIILDEGKLAFLPDSTEFKSPAQVLRTMEPYIDILVNNPDKQIILAGTTATVGSNESCVRFSLKRAEAVKQLLIENGVSIQQVKTIGLGYKHKYHISDLKSDGSLNGNASKNRTVIILDAESDEGKVLLRSK